MVHWSVCLICFAAGCLGAAFMFRKQFLKQVEILKQYELTVTGLFYSIHHDGYNPRLKRIRGCINVLLQLLKEIQLIKEKILKLEEFAIRPHHHSYVKLIVQELKGLYRKLEETSAFHQNINNECLEMEKDIIENAKKYQS